MTKPWRTIEELTEQELQILEQGINLLIEVSHAHALDKGFASLHSKRPLPELLVLQHSEVSETLEWFREGSPASEKIPAFKGEEEEQADLLIRVADLAGEYGYRLAHAVLAKCRFNRTRPTRHGKVC